VTINAATNCTNAIDESLEYECTNISSTKIDDFDHPEGDIVSAFGRSSQHFG
jgi:hypothetical protein